MRLSSAATMPFWVASSASREATFAVSWAICWAGVLMDGYLAIGMPLAEKDMMFIVIHTMAAASRRAGRFRR